MNATPQAGAAVENGSGSSGIGSRGGSGVVGIGVGFGGSKKKAALAAKRKRQVATAEHELVETDSNGGSTGSGGAPQGLTTHRTTTPPLGLVVVRL